MGGFENFNKGYLGVGMTDEEFLSDPANVEILRFVKSLPRGEFERLKNELKVLVPSGLLASSLDNDISKAKEVDCDNRGNFKGTNTTLNGLFSGDDFIASKKSYTPLHSGNKRAIFSMGADDMKGVPTLLSSLAILLRGYGYPRGSPFLEENTGCVWYFFEDEAWTSTEIFRLTMVSRHEFRYSYNLGDFGSSSGVIDDLKHIWDVFPLEGLC